MECNNASEIAELLNSFLNVPLSRKNKVDD